MAFKIEDYIRAKQAVQQAKETADVAETSAISAQSALAQARSAGYDQARLLPLFEASKLTNSQRILAGVSAKKAIEGVGNLATRDNLEEMVGALDSKGQKGFMESYVPSFDDRGKYIGPNSGLEEAAKLHVDATQIKGLLAYVRKGENNTRTNEVLNSKALQLTEEMIRNDSKKYLKVNDNDPDYDLLVEAALELSYADPRVARADFENIAPDAIKNRMKDLYGKIGTGARGSVLKKDIESYVTGTVADEDIEGAFDGYAQAYIQAQQRQ